MKVLVKRFGKLINCESGGVLILVAFAMVVILGMGVIAIDVGSLYQNRRQVVNAADSAALAGVQEIVRAQQDGVTSDAGVRERVTGVVEDYLGYHSTELIEVTEQDGSPIGANSKTVKVVAEKEAKLYFAPAFYALLGGNSTDSSDVGAAATAKLEFVTNPKNIKPFAIAEHLWKELEDGDEFILFASFKKGGKPDPDPDPDEGIYPDWGSGNWGTVNFEQTGHQNNKLAEWIEEGYDGGLPVDSTIWTAPSVGLNSGPCQDAIETILGQEIVVPIIKPVEGDDLPAGSKPVIIVGYAVIVIDSIEGKGANMELKATLIRHWYDVANESSDNPIYDFGLETASLIE